MYQTDKRMFISLGAFLERPPGIRQACVNRGTDCGTRLGKLTVRKVATAKGLERLLDQHGLYLRRSPKGAKMWIQRLTIRGRRADNGIGHYSAMGLAEARAAAFERWKVAHGIGEAEVQLRRRREPVAERPESVAELHLEAPPLEAIIVGRELRKRRPPELRKRCSPGPS